MAYVPATGTVPETVSVPLTRLRFQVGWKAARRTNASALTAVAINSERAELPAASVTLTLPR